MDDTGSILGRGVILFGLKFRLGSDLLLIM